MVVAELGAEADSDQFSAAHTHVLLLPTLTGPAEYIALGSFWNSSISCNRSSTYSRMFRFVSKKTCRPSRLILPQSLFMETATCTTGASHSTPYGAV